MILVILGASGFVYFYYSMSVASVTTVNIDQVLADRNFVGGTYPNRNLTYVIEVRIWSTARALGVQLDKPRFLVDADQVRLLNETLDSGFIPAQSYLTYNLRFTVNESRAIGTLSYGANNLYLGMVTQLTAGLYSQPATITNSVTWNWTTATAMNDGGSCFNHCVP